MEKNWLPLRSGVVLGKGTVLQTEWDSTADAVIASSGTAMRLMPGTLVEVTRLEKQMAGEDVITRTVLWICGPAVLSARNGNWKRFRRSTSRRALVSSRFVAPSMLSMPMAR